MTNIHSDRETLLYPSGEACDGFVVHQITLENDNRNEDTFNTIAWCDTKVWADFIRDAIDHYRKHAGGELPE